MLSTEIEEPFGTQSNDLPLDSMVRTIEIELLGTLGKPTPPPIQAQDHNLLYDLKLPRSPFLS